ncbi:MAG: Maf family protein [Pseudomonadota bacterium]
MRASAHEIILASGSAARRKVLNDAGIPAVSVKPSVDEDALKSEMRGKNLSVAEQAMKLAEAKALEVSDRQTGLVLAGDQMLNLEGRAFDKPKDLEEAKSHLWSLSGQTHTLETAIIIAESGKPVWQHLSQPKLHVRDLSNEFIDAYVESAGDVLLSTVGAYQFEGLGAQIFSKIEGDFFSILGMPLLPLLEYLRSRGVLLT